MREACAEVQTERACDWDVDVGVEETWAVVQFDAVAGRAYHVFVEQEDDGAGYQLDVAFEPCPQAAPERCGDQRDNDFDGRLDCHDTDCTEHPRCVALEGSCDNPIPLGFDARFEGSNQGRPDVEQTHRACDGGGDGGDLYFELVAPADGVACIESFGSDFDTLLEVGGRCPRVFVGEDTGIACDDNSAYSRQSRLQFEVSAGESYYLRVDGSLAQPRGDFVLDVRLAPCAALDVEDCRDERDQDGDLLVDCADPDCAESGYCDVVGEGTCGSPYEVAFADGTARHIGDVLRGGDAHAGSCGGGNPVDNREEVWRFVPPADGVYCINTARRPETATRADGVPWAATSDVCCDPSDPAEGAATCRAYYQQHDDFSAQDVWQLATCGADGACAIDCIPGENCACVTARDCGGASCLLVDRSGGGCEEQGQGGEQPRCTVCGQ